MSAARAPRPTRALRPYEAILEHAELELELAGRGEVEAPGRAGRALGGADGGAAPSTPRRPPAPLLERARLIHERTRIELIRLREACSPSIAATRRAKRAADGYGGQLCRGAPRAWTAAPRAAKDPGARPITGRP